MTKYQCPVCHKRACDSSKHLLLAKLSKSNESKADVIIKCQSCKNTLAVKVTKDTFVIEHMNPQREVTSKNHTSYIARCLPYEHDK